MKRMSYPPLHSPSDSVVQDQMATVRPVDPPKVSAVRTTTDISLVVIITVFRRTPPDCSKVVSQSSSPQVHDIIAED